MRGMTSAVKILVGVNFYPVGVYHAKKTEIKYSFG